MSINIANGTGAEVRAAINETFNLVSSPGFIIFLATVTIPNGWLECDGAAVSRATYADLFAAIGVTFGTGDGSTTFNIPDLRGEFIRGWDHARGVDSGRAFGSNQEDAFKAHAHTLPINGYGSGNRQSMETTTGADEALSPDDLTGDTGENETRPRNVALMACIKY